ncbi:hypothetical protein DUI87_01485 [Hirundo rustica rustica]|uniref:Peptidase A2 domain-containing protein n=1 Tax=Hirundo rustica rustica TaxID=333673 RepID=A0A3M0L5R0_HIRRU|nr:hypothetical protein DUI87_01485 [Hirundo rustica rustica]
MFKSSANGDTAGMQPVFDKNKGPRAVGSSSTAWTLPPCQVTVRPKDRGRFWGEVKAKVEGLSDGADTGAGPAVSGVQLAPSQVPASDPVGPTGQDMAGAAASSEGLQAFPVLQGATHNTYQPLAWQALTELRDAVGKYGLGSAEVMQVLRYFNASLLTPFDIRSLARTLFLPVEYDFFEHKWTQLAVRAVERNATLGPGDPRRMVNPDMLMGTGNYTRAEGQAGFEPLVQEQCQQTGMAALVQTLQLATPQQSFATIVQGVDESFLCFAGWLTAAVEKQFGKRNVEREGETRADTNVSASAPTNGDLLSRLAASTHGSAGVDVCTAESVVIDSEKIHKVPLDAFGPLGDGMSAFLMGRSSATIQGSMVHLGLIDADFLGQIHAMVSTPTPPLTIPKGTQIAQLVPFKSSVSRTEDQSRGDGDFGSTGPPQVHWTAVLTKDRPETLCTVSMAGAMPLEIHLCSLLDTRADVSILFLAAWPSQWPLSLAKTLIAGCENRQWSCLCLTADDRPRGSQCPELEDHDCEKDQLPVNLEILQDLLLQLDSYCQEINMQTPEVYVQKGDRGVLSMGRDGIHLRILKELADDIAKPLSIIFEQSWESREVPADWKLVNVVLIFKKGKTEDPGNYRPASRGKNGARALRESHFNASSSGVPKNSEPPPPALLELDQPCPAIAASSPMEIQEDAKIHLQPMEETHTGAVAEDSERAALMGAWHLARVNPLQGAVRNLQRNEDFMTDANLRVQDIARHGGRVAEVHGNSSDSTGNYDNSGAKHLKELGGGVPGVRENQKNGKMWQDLAALRREADVARALPVA